MARKPIGQKEASPRGAHESLQDSPVKAGIRFVFVSLHAPRKLSAETPLWSVFFSPGVLLPGGGRNLR